MRKFRDIPIRNKLTVLLVITGTTAMLLACTAFVSNDTRFLGESTVRSLRGLAEDLAKRSAKAIRAGDASAAQAALDTLRSEESVTVACLLGRDGKPLARYFRHGTPPVLPAIPASVGSKINDSFADMVTYVKDSKGIAGRISSGQTWEPRAHTRSEALPSYSPSWWSHSAYPFCYLWHSSA